MHPRKFQVQTCLEYSQFGSNFQTINEALEQIWRKIILKTTTGLFFNKGLQQGCPNMSMQWARYLGPRGGKWAQIWKCKYNKESHKNHFEDDVEAWYSSERARKYMSGRVRLTCTLLEIDFLLRKFYYAKTWNMLYMYLSPFLENQVTSYCWLSYLYLRKLRNPFIYLNMYIHCLKQTFLINPNCFPLILQNLNESLVKIHSYIISYSINHFHLIRFSIPVGPTYIGKI